jgi:hypothetical protein
VGLNLTCVNLLFSRKKQNEISRADVDGSCVFAAIIMTLKTCQKCVRPILSIYRKRHTHTHEVSNLCVHFVHTLFLFLSKSLWLSCKKGLGSSRILEKVLLSQHSLLVVGRFFWIHGRSRREKRPEVVAAGSSQA